jgi:2-polyprenyl-6-methoxyphenol hydroxylase-like FAD-dependent oxidoreductase
MVQTARNALPIVVAGGGIGGLACALALARKRFRVLVLEQAAEFGEIGVGLQVAPNALSVLDALGVGEIAKKQALLIERIVMMDGVTGEQVFDIACGARFRERFGNPYAVAHRADIHGALLEACRGNGLITLRTAARVAGYENDGRGAAVLLENGERIDAAAVVGADGVRSQVRRQLLGDGDPPPSGAIIFRALIPYAEMPKELQKPYPTLWAGPNTHIIYYPVRDWSVFNFGATVVTGQTAIDEGADVPPEQALPLFPDMCETPLRVMRIPQSFRQYIIRHREPVDNWTDGAVTLLGDSAHPMVQYIAQGAAMALEDAICLARMADEADGDFPAAFQKYQAIRILRSARVQISSITLHMLLHPGGVRRAVRNSLFDGRSEEEHYDRLSWLFTPPPYVQAELAQER